MEYNFKILIKKKKKTKFTKIIESMYNKLSFNIKHQEFLFKNKLLNEEFYIENMYILNDLYSKINNFEIFSNNKKTNNDIIDNLSNEIYKILEKIISKYGHSSYKNLLDIINKNDFLYNEKSHDFNKIINFIDDYFVILSMQKIRDKDLDSFILEHNLNSVKNEHFPLFTKLLNNSKNNNFYEKIDGASIILFLDSNKSFYVNGFFKQDALGCAKKILNFESKIKDIEKNLEYLETSDNFKEKYIEQLSLRNLIILNAPEISNLIKNDYNELLEYKKKTLSVLIKEFIKSNFEKQRKIIILFLLSNDEAQFTAHIIFDLIVEQSFHTDSIPLSEILFNSLHWKLQKIFKISNKNFENNKKKLENISLSDIPYESRILTLGVTENIKIKAMEKLKEINGSKENSIKAQQWLDGFLKIPFNIFKNEQIFDFLKTSINKMEKYIELFTIKIFEFKIDKLNTKNKYIYNNIIQIVDEFHSNLQKSEYTYSSFIKYIEQIIKSIEKYDGIIENDNIANKNFTKFIVKNINELNEFIKEWNIFTNKKKKYITDVDKILNKCTFGQYDAKNQMKRIIAQWINGTSRGQCFGLCGPPGVGKTTLCKKGFAKCLFDDSGESRPFAFLPLGGATNGSILEGHHYTYLGSTWGKIIDILMETKCMNPIIYIDELDKISKTEHGKEIISILTHITDQSQNKEFYDRYFSSIPIDLSQVLFIFSYNDKDNIDRILLDRIQEIDIKPLSQKEKLIICNDYLCPEIFNNVGFSNNELIFNNEILQKVINDYTHEAGVRKLNEILYDIVREINLKKITSEKDLTYPFKISEEFMENFLSDYPKINSKKIYDNPQIGLVNGLYATSSGLGGLTIIQVMKTISEKKFGLEKLTGNQGDVMKESMNCALTLAWNIIPDEKRNEIRDGSENLGFHIHCPESATPKDGPSAGLAITTAIISRIMNIPIKNNVAMTGEVDLLGTAREIGGLYSKLQGAFNADVEIVLVPRDNEKDLDIIFKKEKDDNEIINSKKNRIFRKKIEIILVDNIFDVLENALIENNIIFNKKF